MRRKLRQGLLLLAATLVGLLAPQAGADIIIDDFDTVPTVVIDGESVDIQTVRDITSGNAGRANTFDATLVAPTPDIWGLYRELYVQRNVVGSGGVELTVSGGASLNSQEPSTAPTLLSPDIAHITWDNNGSALGGLPNFGDASSSFLGEAGFSLTSNAINLSRFAAIQVWDQSGSTDSVTFEIEAAETTHQVSFSSFTGINWNQVGAIRLHFLTDDLLFDEFRTVTTVTDLAPVVPVPPALALGALGMAVVAGFRRRSSASVA